MSFSIVLPTLWPYITDDGKNYQYGEYLGWALTLFSAGQMIAAPIFDLWMDSRPTKEVLCGSMILLMVGSGLYTLYPVEIAAILISRFLIGIAASNYSVNHSYLAYVVSQKDQMRVLSIQKFCSVLGFICGPVVALLVSFQKDWSGQFVNEWTMPGYVLGILGLIGFFWVLFLDEHSERKDLGKNMRSFQDFLSFRLGASFPDTASLICIFLYTTLTFGITTIETISIPFAFHNFKTSNLVTKTGGCVFYTMIGLFCGLSLFFLRVARLVYRLNDTLLMVVSFFCVMLGNALMFAPQSSVFRFLLGVFFGVVGYSFGISSLVSVFYMVLRPAARVFMSGWVTTGAGVARILTPVLVSFLYYPVGAREDWNPTAFAFFVFTESVLLLAFCVSVLFWRRLSGLTAQRSERLPKISRSPQEVIKEALCL